MYPLPPQSKLIQVAPMKSSVPHLPLGYDITSKWKNCCRSSWCMHIYRKYIKIKNQPVDSVIIDSSTLIAVIINTEIID